jgi:hypothetical protein
MPPLETPCGKRRSSAWRRRHGVRPQVEQLETRLVPSAPPPLPVGAAVPVQPISAGTTPPGANNPGTGTNAITPVQSSPATGGTSTLVTIPVDPTDGTMPPLTTGGTGDGGSTTGSGTGTIGTGDGGDTSGIGTGTIGTGDGGSTTGIGTGTTGTGDGGSTTGIGTGTDTGTTGTGGSTTGTDTGTTGTGDGGSTTGTGTGTTLLTEPDG